MNLSSKIVIAVGRTNEGAHQTTNCMASQYFNNVDCPTWVNLVEEPEVLDSHMPSASSHLLGLVLASVNASLLSSKTVDLVVYGMGSEVRQNEVLISSVMRRSGMSDHML